MKNLLLSISRFAITAWVGAAALFVVTLVIEVSSDKIDSPIRNELARQRFPAFYSFGFTLVIVALASSLAGGSKLVGTRRSWIYIGLLSLVLLIMVVDYFAVFLPLIAMLADDEASRPASFVGYHEASKYINALHVGLCAIAALLIAWPQIKDERRT